MPQPPPTGERAFLKSLRARAARASGLSDEPVRPARKFPLQSKSQTTRALTLGIGDDCAILRPPAGHELLVTTDFSLETIHFRREWHTPESVGHRCLARGLSDIAAMGGQPLAAFLSLALPAELARSRGKQMPWRTRFLDGFLALADMHRVPLAGGDTSMSPLMAAAAQQCLRSERKTLGATAKATGWALADIVLVGSVPHNRALLRSGAKPGDHIYVTGCLGGAAAELARLAAHPERFRSVRAEGAEGTGHSAANPHPHLFPQPRLTVGARLLRNHRASAAIDISDGLSTDLDHLCEESNLAAAIDAASLPIHPLAKEEPASERLRLALHGGEDYELLFTASPDVTMPQRIAGVPITCIGTMQKRTRRSPRVSLAEQMDGRTRIRPLPAGGWEHSV